VWELVADDFSPCSDSIGSNQPKHRQTSVRLRVSKTCLKCLFGEESRLSWIPSPPSNTINVEEEESDAIVRNKDNTVWTNQKFRVKGITLALHQCGSAVLSLMVEWIPDSPDSHEKAEEEEEEESKGDRNKDPPPNLRPLEERLNGMSDPVLVQWVCTCPSIDLKSSDPSKGKEKKGDSSSSSSSARNLRRREAHVLALGKLANAIKEEGDAGASLADLADWLVALPTEPPSAPVFRADRSGSCFLHNFVAATQPGHRAQLLSGLQNEGLKTMASLQRTLVLSTDSHAETLCMSLFREMVEDILLAKDVLKRISWNSLRHAELWETARLDHENRLHMLTLGSDTTPLETQQQDIEEALAREVYRLSVLCAGVTLRSTTDFGSQTRQRRLDRLSQSLLSCLTEFRSELQTVLGVPSVSMAVEGHLQQQLNNIKQATNSRHKRSYRQDRAEADERIRRLLLKEAKRRRLEIILQSISAMTLPMFLVTNYFTMNVPDVPQISFWYVSLLTLFFFKNALKKKKKKYNRYVFLLTAVVAIILLAALLSVWACYFWNRAKTKQRLVNATTKLRHKGKLTWNKLSPHHRSKKKPRSDVFAPPLKDHHEHVDSLDEPRATSMDVLLHPSRGI